MRAPMESVLPGLPAEAENAVRTKRPKLSYPSRGGGFGEAWRFQYSGLALSRFCVRFAAVAAQGAPVSGSGLSGLAAAYAVSVSYGRAAAGAGGAAGLERAA